MVDMKKKICTRLVEEVRLMVNVASDLHFNTLLHVRYVLKTSFVNRFCVVDYLKKISFRLVSVTYFHINSVRITKVVKHSFVVVVWQDISLLRELKTILFSQHKSKRTVYMQLFFGNLANTLKITVYRPITQLQPWSLTKGLGSIQPIIILRFLFAIESR